MAMPDPITITIGGTAYTLARIQTGTTEGRFQDPSKMVTLSFTPTVTRGKRTVVAARLTIKKITTDPLVSTTNMEVSQTVTVAFNLPSTGFSIDECVKAFTALSTLLTADTNSKLQKLVNQES